MRRARSSSRRGVTLIMVLGVLAVLALLATAFATLQATEAQIARNYEDTVRVKLLAMSGIQNAVARLGSSAAITGDPAMTYWGNNLTETGSPEASVPLERAQNPSFAIEDEAIQNPTDDNVKPLTVQLDGVTVGLSGVMSEGTYAIHGDVFRVRVNDANSLLFLNDGLEEGKDGPTSKNLRRILNTLGEIVGERHIGDKIVDARPAKGFIAKRELEDLLGAVVAAKINPFVTTRAWVDRAVANPVPISRETLPAYPIKYNEKLGVFRYGRSFGTGGAHLSSWPLKFAPDHADPRGIDHSVMALDELNPQWIQLTRRAPLNVNLAPKEILTAVISGLRGVFLVERRKSNPHPWNVYSFMSHPKYDNTPGGLRGDEYGYLYSTLPFIGPGMTVTEGVSAVKVAEEIIACRSRKPSPACPSINYKSVWYGGPFRSWRQFNAFCDGLVAGGLLKDDRQIFYDFQASGKKGASSNTGPDTLVPSTIQQRFAGQALADVLKANFNPNLTLNESNVDANLTTIVDKTDLITCSTEFCFTPMGIFEIESEGMIVRTYKGGDLLYYRRGEIVARKKVYSIAKIFDVHRETAQSDFMEGTLDAAAGGSTDNGKGLVVGPEPDLGPVAKECAHSGWIQLSTVGGASGHGGADRDATAHGHFSQGFDLHHHASGTVKPARSFVAFQNQPDRTEGTAGPYDGSAGRHRLGRSWRSQDPPASPEFFAPGDLRIDGAYVERDSALLYENSAAVFGLEGTVSYWVKPSFAPEMTGKPRTYFCVDQAFKQKKPATLVQLMHGQWFFASHDADADAPSPNETAPMTYSGGPWVPMSMAAGYSTHEEWGGAVGRVTPSLNHRSHKDSSKPDLLRHRGWTHIAYYWNMNRDEVTLLINGEALPQTRSIKVHPQKYNRVEDFLAAPLRLGEPSTTMTLNGKQMRNWSADSTIDEFYLWKGNHLEDARDQWSRGRYYVPRSGKEGVFTSQPLKLVPPTLRDGAPVASAKVTAVAAPQPQIKVLGAAWTWHAEGTGKNGETTLTDYLNQDPLESRVGLSMVLNGNATGEELKNDGGSQLRGVIANPGDVLKYRLKFHTPAAEVDSILLTTPVVDDVSIYYTAGTRFLYYELCGGGL